MGNIHLTGGTSLEGSVRIQGSKNAVLPMMAAALLHKGVTTLTNCPLIRDVFCMVDILRSLGCVVTWEEHTMHMDCSHLRRGRIPEEYAVRMRSSITCMGSLLARIGMCEMPYPGGCMIGQRPIDMHLELFRHMGAQIVEREGVLYSVCGKCHGFTYTFPRRSVGATENGVLAAVLCDGVTRLENCATEPEVGWMCRCINSMGGKIEGIGSKTLQITGVAELQDAAFPVPPDRIVAGTYLCAGAITRGKVVLEPVIMEEMQAILAVYKKMGGQYEGKGGKLFTNSAHVHLPVPFLETAVYPGLPTDLQSPLLSVLSVASGVSILRETVFENRFLAAEQLQKMGARIGIYDREAKVTGRDMLTGCEVVAQELRGGAALVLAGLVASGETVIRNAEYIERGYEDICRDLGNLGARIHKE